MTTTIKFGTDGWRGIIADDFTFDNVRVCAQAVARFLKEDGRAGAGMVVGYDTRFASEDFAAVAAEVLAANGIKVYLSSKPAPTPVISYGIVSKKAGGAIVITASHNPGKWNGFKYKPHYAGSASEEVVAALERHISNTASGSYVARLPLATATANGLVETFDPLAPYVEHIARLVDLNALRSAGLKVVVDSMHGAGAGYLKGLLRGGKTAVSEIRSVRNPAFPGMGQPEPITHNLHPLISRVRSSGASVGLATDGDADRLGVIDEKGNFLTTLQVFSLLTLYMLEVRKEKGAVVKSITTSRMVNQLAKLYGVPVYETPVGFKYIGPVMMKENASIAGEESGGYAFRGHIPERDGVLSALYFLDLMVKTGRTPSELIKYLYSKVGESYYDRIDIPFSPDKRQATVLRVSAARPKEMAGLKVRAIDTTDGFRFLFEDTSWVLIRFSGTEPLLRVYGESDSPHRVATLLQSAKDMAGV